MRMKRNWSYRLSLAILLLCIFQIASVSVAGELNSYGVQSDNPYVVRRFIQDGQSIDEVIVPGRPPESYQAPAAIIPETAAGTKTLSTVPAFDWSYGCSATAAAMMFGYYDNTGYPNLYAGPTNGGVCPMTNAVWGKGESPLSATHQGIDGRTIKGHVDDYWIAYDSTAPDPFIGKWTEHVQGECTGDFMGTNQSSKSNTDGSTTFWNYTDGSALSDYTGAEPGKRDGCHGMKLFFASRGYTVVSNYSQYIMGYNGNTKGFTFENYKQEIDAGRPVLIQVDGHTMLGYGYNDTGSLVYLHDTWDYVSHSMTWGGSYSGMAHYGVTVFVPSPSVAKTPVLAASFVGLGLFIYNSDGSWTGLTSAIPENLIYFGSTLYVDFGASYGLQKWNGAAWTPLTSANPRSMVASDSALYVDLTSYGLWKWNGTAWSGQLTSLNAESMVASGSVLYVDFGASNGLWKWNGTAWSGQLTSANPDKIAIAN
ncbi:MAG: C39 family peptidase [Deltaproteobacteria bacterium]